MAKMRLTCGKKIKHGDFTGLAANYAGYRPGYSEHVLTAILGILKKKLNAIEAADIGAGTGIWTRMLAAKGCKVIAVEPNDEMRKYGIAGNKGLDIHWKKGSAEKIPLKNGCCDLVTMASSFHWTEFQTAVREFSRILKKNGWFAALWNPRLIEVNPLLAEIERELKRIVPRLKRVSSGKSEFCNSLTQRLDECGYFKEIIYMESRHVEHMTRERYIGIWESVNDIRVQAGAKRFKTFMDYIKTRLSGIEYIDAAYLTRAWAAKIKK